MDDNIHLGDGVRDEVIADVNEQLKGIAKRTIEIFFSFLEEKVKVLPEKIKKLRNNPEIEKRMITMWSEYLFNKGLIPSGYRGLPDHLLISNFRQEGYIDGLYVGYILAMMALVDINASSDIVLSARDYIRPNLLGNSYTKKGEFIDLYKSQKYNWVEKGNKVPPCEE